MKNVSRHDEWQKVAEELQAEQIKLASYDKTLIEKVGNFKGLKVLDYGCGPCMLASAMQRLGADVKAYDISPEMREKCAARIGQENVYSSVEEIPSGEFDIVTCNIVMCIVPEEEVSNITRNIKRALNTNGTAYIGFCNPRIFDVLESSLDFRFPTGQRYEENHSYKKLKKEGNYEIVELHRPLEWYQRVFKRAGFGSMDIFFTPQYEMKGRKVEDFSIFEVGK